jgi:phosphoglucosamine mutase
VFAELGAEVDAIGNKPTGSTSTATSDRRMPQASEHAVSRRRADLGIAFDGDGDRLQMVDRDGVLVDGDQLLYVLATDWHASGACAVRWSAR